MEEKKRVITQEEFNNIRNSLCKLIPMELVAQMSDVHLNELRDMLDAYSAAMSTLIRNREHVYHHASKAK